ncbi:MAG TPA: monovalent cation:proton antiporter-2 (CPA2) family protein [Gammaproteobacteria bacterium]
MLELLVLLSAAVVAVPLFQRLGLGSVLGFLTAGVVVGPSVLGLIDDIEAIRHLAELGIVFLLFLIGIEMKPARLWRMRRQVFGFGLAQVVLTTLVLTVLGRLAGLPPPVPLLLGSALALSSTAFVLQLLAERNELATHHGRLAFAVLLLQDLAVVPLLALVPLLGGEGLELEVKIGFAILEALVIFAGVLVAGRHLFGPLFRHVAASRNSEVFTALALLLVLGIAELMEVAGLSMAMGAFIAGLLIAESEFRHQVVADIQPFRGLLLGLFFMSVGMSVNLDGLVGDFANVLLWLLVLVVVKVTVMWPVALLAGLRGAPAQAVALLLAQGGEFGFVLFGVAHHAGLLDEMLFQRAILVVALSMALTPLLVYIADRLLVAQRARLAVSALGVTAAATGEEEPLPVLIAGFGRVGRRIADLLVTAGIPYFAIEQDAETVSHAREEGYRVFFGDVSRPEVLRAAGIRGARMAVIAVDRGEPTEQTVTAIRRESSRVPIYVRARDRAHCRRMLQLGATHTVSETLETSLQLAGDALTGSGLPRERVDQLIDSFRREYHTDTGDPPEPHSPAASDKPLA